MNQVTAKVGRRWPRLHHVSSRAALALSALLFAEAVDEAGIPPACSTW